MGWFSSDPAVAEDPNDVGYDDDEDVAAEALRVERMGGVLGEEEGEVVLRGLRKVYRTQQASFKRRVVLFAEGPGICFSLPGNTDRIARHEACTAVERLANWI